MIEAGGKNHWLIEVAHLHPAGRAVYLEDSSVSYKELLKEVLIAAEYLSRNEIVRDENVGILYRHDYGFIVLVNALWFLGAVPVPLSTKLTGSELCDQSLKIGIRHIITDDYNSNCISNSEKITKITYSLHLKNEQYSNTPAQFKPDNKALIMFTSGSSGKPKAVVHTFNSLYESIRLSDCFTHYTPEDVLLVSLPMYHVGGFMIPQRALLTGGAAAFPESLQFEDICESLNTINPSIISIVPTTLLRFVEEEIKPNKKLRCAFTGGGPAHDKIILDAFSAGWPAVKVYGSTETCSMVTALDITELPGMVSSAGKTLGAVECKIENAELCIKSPSLFQQYYNDENETRAKLINGYYHTGDFGRIENDFIYIESRREDLIISGGENVSAVEVETSIRLMDMIEEVYVFPTDDDKWGQIVCAAIKPKEGAHLNAEIIKEFLSGIISSYKIPKKFYFVEEIPRNEMGKINKAALLKIIKLL